MTLGAPPAGLEAWLERVALETERRRYGAAQALEGRRWWWECTAGWLVGRSDLVGLVVVAETGAAPPRAPEPPAYYSHTGSGPHDGSRSGGIGVADVGAWLEYLETGRAVHDAAARVRARERKRRPRRRRKRSSTPATERAQRPAPEAPHGYRWVAFDHPTAGAGWILEPVLGQGELF